MHWTPWLTIQLSKTRLVRILNLHSQLFTCDLRLNLYIICIAHPGACRNRLQFRSDYGSNGGHRLQARMYAAEDTDLADFAMIQNLVAAYPPRSSKLEIYTSINDYVKTRRNAYPNVRSSPRISEFIKKGSSSIQDALTIHLRYYLDTGDEFTNGPHRDIAGGDVDFYLMDGFVKHPERVSLAPGVIESRWHVTTRAEYNSIDLEKDKTVLCKQREITRQLKLKLGDKWGGPYVNYLDGSADKKDYYDPTGGSAHFAKVKEIKDKWDPDNFFKKTKGINVNDDSIACLEEFCATLTPYYEGWTF
mmetsp:Transcript_6990/g.10012  ORF Transcript_6990/g.10012 Transcript_6990/m.10012 type:complete len:304 (-) Transcript_6990:65-976(-)